MSGCECECLDIYNLTAYDPQSSDLSLFVTIELGKNRKHGGCIALTRSAALAWLHGEGGSDANCVRKGVQEPHGRGDDTGGVSKRFQNITAGNTCYLCSYLCRNG